jgi:aspartyl-tRNA(Asn)/glutamyl-tRNA(Gln) amidotransferase subunit A
MYLEDIFSVPASLVGLPAISIPVVSKSLPIGIQLMGGRFEDSKVLAAAEELEKYIGLLPKPKI